MSGVTMVGYCVDGAPVWQVAEDGFIGGEHLVDEDAVRKAMATPGWRSHTRKSFVLQFGPITKEKP